MFQLKKLLQDNMEKIRITQIRSAIGCREKQKRTIKALGLGKLHRQRELTRTPIIWGMIQKVSHLLEVETISE